MELMKQESVGDFKLPRKWTTVVMIFALVPLVLFAPTSGFAQASTGGNNQDRSRGVTGPRKQLATIVFAGLGGAILGLSTLSFYGRPQDKLSNIAVGFAFGVIGGTILMTYRAATNPSELYGRQILIEREQMLTSAYNVPVDSIAGQAGPAFTTPVWNFSWSF